MAAAARRFGGLAVVLTALAAACSASTGPSPGTDGAASDASFADVPAARDVTAAVDASAPGCVLSPSTQDAFAAFDRACMTDGDCALVQHLNSCCGDTLFMGIDGRCVDAFASAESAWVAAHPAACGCARPDSTDTGLSPVTPDAVSARCVAGRCAALLSASCGATRCAPGQACRSETCGGPCALCPAVPTCVDVAPACALATTCGCLVASCGAAGCNRHVTEGLDCACP
jgi:hypothetical protein